MLLYAQRVCCSANGSVVYALSHVDLRLMASYDFGTSWSVVMNPCLLGSFGCSADGKSVYALSKQNGRALQRSDDGGITWQELPTKFEIDRIEVNRTKGIIEALECYQPAYGIEAQKAYKGFWETADGGLTWKTNGRQYNYDKGIGTAMPHPEDTQASSEDGSVVYRATGNEYRVPIMEEMRIPTLEISGDKGKTWSPLNLSFEPPKTEWVHMDGAIPDPRLAELEEARKNPKIDRGIPGVDFGNGPGKPR
jgi:hypothetical protein